MKGSVLSIVFSYLKIESNQINRVNPPAICSYRGLTRKRGETKVNMTLTSTEFIGNQQWKKRQHIFPIKLSIFDRDKSRTRETK